MLLSETTRPRKLRDVIGQEIVISKLTRYMKDPWNTPHMIFSGPPGCGKTSAICAYGREVYGDNYEKSVRFMNLSGERSVQTILKKVHGVCKYYHEKKGTKGLFICDESDCMTSEAQDIMSHCVSLYESRWIFVFIMNRLSEISDTLKGICEIHQFQPIKNPEDLLSRVLPKEISREDASRMAEYYSGDLRKILNASQGMLYSIKGVIPEWKTETENRASMLKHIKTVILTHKAKLPKALLKSLLEIAVALYRPGSIIPYQYALRDAIDNYPIFFSSKQNEQHPFDGSTA